jgi:hypothetical protein
VLFIGQDEPNLMQATHISMFAGGDLASGAAADEGQAQGDHAAGGLSSAPHACRAVSITPFLARQGLLLLPRRFIAKINFRLLQTKSLANVRRISCMWWLPLHFRMPAGSDAAMARVQGARVAPPAAAAGK